jgi:hypothetical protein
MANMPIYVGFMVSTATAYGLFDIEVPDDNGSDGLNIRTRPFGISCIPLANDAWVIGREVYELGDLGENDYRSIDDAIIILLEHKKTVMQGLVAAGADLSEFEVIQPGRGPVLVRHPQPYFINAA